MARFFNFHIVAYLHLFWNYFVYYSGWQKIHSLTKVTVWFFFFFFFFCFFFFFIFYIFFFFFFFFFLWVSFYLEYITLAYILSSTLYMLGNCSAYYGLISMVVTALGQEKIGNQKLKITDSLFWINHRNPKTNIK